MYFNKKVAWLDKLYWPKPPLSVKLGGHASASHTLVRDSSAVRRLLFRLAVAVGRQRALHTENSGFAAATLR
jgi:hypothetical protein